MYMYYALIKLRWSPSALYEFFKNDYEDKRFKVLIKSLINYHVEEENKAAEKSRK